MKRFFSRRGGWSKHVDATYRSGLEDKVAAQLRDADIDAKYEEYQIPYEIPASPHTYTPDFIIMQEKKYSKTCNNINKL